ncbi:MAG: hypothetical protein AB8G23_11745 [Myxococcota bacterium]
MTEQSKGDERAQHAELSSLIRDSGSSPAAIAKLLDSLPGELRGRVVRLLGRSDQRALYEKASGYAALTLADLVPASCADLEEVRFLGRNTLPAFRIFEKRFCRMPGADAAHPDRLAGYNFQTMSAVTGPGYYVAVEDREKAEVLVDYHLLPEATPADWPAVKSNESGLGRFVYGFMVDRLRRVSDHVLIGSAARNGQDLGSYFVLSRFN